MALRARLVEYLLLLASTIVGECDMSRRKEGLAVVEVVVVVMGWAESGLPSCYVSKQRRGFLFFSPSFTLSCYLKHSYTSPLHVPVKLNEWILPVFVKV